jgi:hypothetical protein
VRRKIFFFWFSLSLWPLKCRTSSRRDTIITKRRRFCSCLCSMICLIKEIRDLLLFLPFG